MPAVSVLNTQVNCILADPYLVSTCAAVQSSFYIQTVLIRILTFAHDNHFCNIVRHAAVELLRLFLTAVMVTLWCHACLNHRDKVLVANCIIDAHFHLVQAGFSTILYCNKNNVKCF